MRILLGLALAATLVFATGCGSTEPEGLANPPKTAEADTKKPETAPATDTGKKDDKPVDTGHETDYKPEKPLPGPGTTSTLGK